MKETLPDVLVEAINVPNIEPNSTPAQSLSPVLDLFEQLGVLTESAYTDKSDGKSILLYRVEFGDRNVIGIMFYVG